MARTGQGPGLAAAVDAARQRASVGEISDAMEKAWGRHKATPKVVSNVYAGAYDDDPEYTTLVNRLSDFAANLGEKPRVMVAKLGQDGHDRGAKVIASAFGDIGFDVVAGDLFQTPAEAAEAAIREKVHIVGASSLAAGHKTLLPELVEELKKRGAENIVVVAGGVIPRQDYKFLTDHGVSAVFGPGTNVLEAARSVLGLIEGKLTNR
jgi:methylmalonyl-CoA mutase